MQLGHPNQQSGQQSGRETAQPALDQQQSSQQGGRSSSSKRLSDNHAVRLPTPSPTNSPSPSPPLPPRTTSHDSPHATASAPPLPQQHSLSQSNQQSNDDDYLFAIANSTTYPSFHDFQHDDDKNDNNVNNVKDAKHDKNVNVDVKNNDSNECINKANKGNTQVSNNVNNTPNDDILLALNYSQSPPSSPDSLSHSYNTPLSQSQQQQKVASNSNHFPSSFQSSKSAIQRANLARQRRQTALNQPGKLNHKRNQTFGGKPHNVHDAWAPSSDDDEDLLSTDEEDNEHDKDEDNIVPLKTRVQRSKEAEMLAKQKQQMEVEQQKNVNSFGIPTSLLNDDNYDSSPNQQDGSEYHNEIDETIEDLNNQFNRHSITQNGNSRSYRQSTLTTSNNSKNGNNIRERLARRQSAEAALIANQYRQSLMPQIKYQQQQQLQNQRQSMWSGVLDHNYVNNNAYQSERFIQLNDENMNSDHQKFAPFGLLQAGMNNKMNKTAKAQEKYARDYGVGMILPPTKVPDPQYGLLGQIADYEKDRKRVGGLGALLTERDRERRRYNNDPYQQYQSQYSPNQVDNYNRQSAMYMQSPMSSPPFFDPSMSMMAMNQLQQQQLMMQGVIHAQQAYNTTLFQFQQANQMAFNTPPPMAAPPYAQQNPSFYGNQNFNYSNDGVTGLGVGFQPPPTQRPSSRLHSPYMHSRPQSTFFSDAK